MSDDNEATKREGVHSERTPKRQEQQYLARGTLVGRYVIVDKLGEGGMGVVYSAFDPELDRKIAIKLLQAQPASGSSGGEQAWLLREAQALARLQHPNVVAVHDVGVLPGDQVFVAMELVDGVTMRQWLKEKARTWREVLPVMREAGAGLAAAHAAELVHRDFKPENVLVGNDGRVRVMDFGLARLRRDGDAKGLTPPISPTDSAQSPLSVDLTQVGHVVGTPAYMAPEIYDEHPADARTDQFAFGVTLFEGIYHQRPFDKRELMPSRSAPPKPAIPANARVPASIARIALRAIAIDPNARFAGMAELLRELAKDPLAGRRRLVYVAGAAAAIAVAGGVAFGFARHRGQLCTGAADRLANVWDEPTKGAAQKAFLATKKPYASRSFDGIARALDDYSGQWTRAVTESCQATRVHGEQSEETFALREACFDQRLEELRAFTRLIAQADQGLVTKGDQAVFALVPVAECSNVKALRSPGLPPAEIRAKVNELEAKLAEAKAQMIAGNYLPALGAAKIAADGGYALHWEPLAAEALATRGASLLGAGNSDDALAALREATWASMRGKRDDYAATNAIAVAGVISDRLGKPLEAQVWIDLANAEAARAGADPHLMTYVYGTSGMLAAERGDLTTAVELYEKSEALAVQNYGKDGPALASIEGDFATTLSRAGAYGRAVPYYEHALALRIASVGDEHPDVAQELSNVGIAYRHIGQLERSHRALERALALREKLYGKRSPMLVPTLDNMADLLAEEKDYTGSLALMDRAKAMAQVLPGTAHPLYHHLMTDYAEILVAAGRYDEARKIFDDVFALEAKTQSPELPATQTQRARLAIAEQKWSEAVEWAQKSVDGFEAASGKDNSLIWRPLGVLGRAKLELGEIDAARAALERARAIAKRAQIPDDDRRELDQAAGKLPP